MYTQFHQILRSIFLLLLYALAGSTAHAQIITTIAGNGSSGYSGDGGAATAARLHNPAHLIIGKNHEIYFTDYYNNVVRKINSSGVISTVFGTGSAGFSGDGGPASAARLSAPNGISIDLNGNIYIGDQGNYRVRKVDTFNVITTFAGNGSGGYSGDGGPATAARIMTVLTTPDRYGNLYLADYTNQRVRKVNTSGIISTVIGTGAAGSSGDGGPATAATIYQPTSVDIDTFGNIYLADQLNCKIRKVNSSGIISTIAGTGTVGYTGDGGPATAARLYYPAEIRVDKTGNLYFTDSYNYVVRKISTSGIITTVAGTGTAGYTGDGGPATSARLNQCWGVTLDSCGSFYVTDAFNMVVRRVTALPPSIIVGPDSVCVGSAVTLTDSTSGGLWTSSDTSIASIVHSTGVLTGVSTGHAIITYSLGPGCTVTDTETVNPMPSVIGGTTNLCPGATVTLTDSVSGGTWSSSATGVATINSSTGVLTGVSAGTAIITYRLPTGCFVVTSITVSSTPSAGSISGSSTVCSGATITLTSSVSGGTWSSVYTSIATITSGGVVTGVSAGVDTIKYSVTSSCGTGVAIKVITVIPPAVPGTLSGPASVCAGSNVTLGSTVSGGVWSSGSTSVATITSGGVVTGVSAGSVTLSYSVTNACGTVSATKTIAVNALPVITIAPAVVGICQGSTVSLSAGGATTYSWSPAATLSATSGVAVVASPTVTTTYSVTGVDANGCSGSAMRTVTVNDLPVISITSPVDVCVGSSATLSVTGASTYSWSPATGLSASTGATVLSSPVTTTHYTITGIDANGCINTAVVTVNIHPIPAPPAVTSPVTYCTTATATALTASGSGLLWYTTLTGGTGTATAPVPSTASVSTTTWYVSTTVNGCESPRDSIVVIVLDNAIAGFEYTVKYGCSKDTVEFTNTSVYASNFHWYFGDGTTLHETTLNNPIHVYPPSYGVNSDYVVKLLANNSICFDDSVTQIVTITPNPNPPFHLINVTPGQSVQFGNSIQLNAGGAVTYYWTPNDGTLSNPNINNPIAMPTVPVTYVVHGYDKQGCLDSAIVAIDVIFDDTDIVPSAFTPNGDGLNDVFRLRLKHTKLVDFSIFNRWGQLVFHTADIAGGWDGVTNGVPQDMGVYYYQVITAHSDGTDRTYKGALTLIR